MKTLSVMALSLALAAPVSGATAMHIAAESVARSEVVALGRDLVVDGEAMKDVAVLNGDAKVSGLVKGDLVVLGGSVQLESTARILGDVFAVGGDINTSPGAQIDGRAAAYPALGAAWLTLLEGPSLGLSASSPVVLAAKFALLTAWLALTLGLLAVTGRQVLASSEIAQVEPARSFVTGLTAVIALFLLAVALTTFVPGMAGVPLLVLVLLFALLLKLWGLVTIFHAFGDTLAQRLLKRRLQPLNAATLGLVVLGGIKLIPWVGTIGWWMASLVGIGVALNSKFGRREPWLEIPSDRLALSR